TVSQTMSSFKEEPAQFFALLLTIPPAVHNSLVMGTIAFDFYKDKTGAYPGNPSFPGVYAVGLAIRGRDGRFLSANELDRLANALEGYVNAVELWVSYGGHRDLMTSEELGVLDDALRIDAVRRGVELDGKPGHLAGNLPTCAKAREYIKIDPSLTPIAKETVYQHQSPLYIGCSAELPKRMKAHSLSNEQQRNNLNSSDPVLALTVSCIEHVLKLEPETFVIPVTYTWCGTDLGLCEMLCICLASSLVTQGGLNLEAGGAQSPQDNAKVRGYILGECDWASETSKATQRHMDDLKYVVTKMQVVEGQIKNPIFAKLASIREELIKTCQQYNLDAQSYQARIQE
ncbi:hypothetical protein QBC44DRAFT_246917, partial [Cladorrhinum sp. PSN332]